VKAALTTIDPKIDFRYISRSIGPQNSVGHSWTPPSTVTVQTAYGGSNHNDWLSWLAPMGKLGSIDPTSHNWVGDDIDKFIGVDVLIIVVYQDQGGQGGITWGNYGTSSDIIPALGGGQSADQLAAIAGAEDYIRKAYRCFSQYKVLVYYDSQAPIPSEPGEGSLLLWYITPPAVPGGSSETIGGVTAYSRSGVAYVTRDDYAPATPQILGILNPADGLVYNYWIHTTTTNIWSSIDTWQQGQLAQICTDLTDYGFEFKGNVSGGSGSFLSDIKAWWGYH
jgi:hypothetical protein